MTIQAARMFRLALAPCHGSLPFPPFDFASRPHHNGSVAERIFLSLWLRDYSQSTMLEYWRRVIEAFPVSGSATGGSLSVYPFDWTETPVLERGFGEETSAEELVNLASEFLHDDYAYEAEMNWDLWLPVPAAQLGVSLGSGPIQDDGEESGYPSRDSNGAVADSNQDSVEEEDLAIFATADWRRTPSPVLLACMGPQFEAEDAGNRADIQIGFGLDLPFLPPDEDALDELDPEMDPDLAELRTRENLQQLVAFVHRLDEILPVTKRLLWCESGENLAEKILGAWNLGL